MSGENYLVHGTVDGSGQIAHTIRASPATVSSCRHWQSLSITRDTSPPVFNFWHLYDVWYLQGDHWPGGGAVAQRVERWTCDEKVVGSIPAQYEVDKEIQGVGSSDEVKHNDRSDH